jgi:TonB-dependent receptor
MSNVFTEKWASRKINASLTFLVCFVLLCFIFNGMVLAQGSVASIVANATTGEYLPGANVYLEGTNLGVSTDREGFFRISNIPDGSYTLVVNYIGFSEFRTEITISASNRNVVLDEIGLAVEAVEADAIVTEGLREGQIKALNLQRVSPNIINVVAREQMEKFPDYTTADVLQRLPGVFIDRSQGEGRYVLVRGTEPRLSNVKVNGEELATNRVQERYSQLDIIGSNQMASIEVIKALTPDMDGDAIGGTVNLITRSAFDYQGRRIRASLGSGYSNLKGNPIWQGKASYSDRFGADQNIGFTFTANYDRTDKGAHGAERAWGSRNGFDDVMREMDLRDYYTTRDRYGLGATFEYRMDPKNRWYFSGMYNRFDDDQSRGRKRYRFDRGTFLSRESVQNARVIVAHASRVEELTQQQYSAGGEHQFNAFNIDYKLAASFAKEEHPEQIESEFEVRRVDFQMNLDDPEFPKWEVTNDVDLNDASIYALQGADFRSTMSNDQNIVGTLNFSIPFNIGAIATELKFGGKARFKEKDRDDTRFGYSWEGDDVTLEQFKFSEDTDDFLNGNYRYGPQVDPDKFESFFKANRDQADGFEGEENIWDSRGQTYKAKEDIYAGYGMATAKFSNFTLVAGGRLETTVNDYTGTLLVYDDSGDLTTSVDTTADRTYSFFMPMVHLKYTLNRMTNFRFAVTRTMARPNYFDLVPFLSINPDREEIREGNPDLDITQATNLDLMAEHYFAGIGVVSGGFFYKQLENILYEKRADIDNPASQFDGWEFRGPVNGGDATLYGFEINWQQQLTFLPGIWGGFGIYANYTKTFSESDLADEQTGEGRKLDALPGQSGDVGNFALSYEWGKFSSRISLMFQDKYLITIGGADDGSSDEYRDSHLQMDFSASYKVIPQMDLFAEVVNISNEPKKEYIGISTRPVFQEYYGWWMRAGIRFTL